MLVSAHFSYVYQNTSLHFSLLIFDNFFVNVSQSKLLSWEFEFGFILTMISYLEARRTTLKAQKLCHLRPQWPQRGSTHMHATSPPRYRPRPSHCIFCLAICWGCYGGTVLGFLPQVFFVYRGFSPACFVIKLFPWWNSTDFLRCDVDGLPDGQRLHFTKWRKINLRLFGKGRVLLRN